MQLKLSQKELKFMDGNKNDKIININAEINELRKRTKNLGYFEK